MLIVRQKARNQLLRHQQDQPGNEGLPPPQRATMKQPPQALNNHITSSFVMFWCLPLCFFKSALQSGTGVLPLFFPEPWLRFPDPSPCPLAPMGLKAACSSFLSFSLERCLIPVEPTNSLLRFCLSFPRFHFSTSRFIFFRFPRKYGDSGGIDGLMGYNSTRDPL